MKRAELKNQLNEAIENLQTDLAILKKKMAFPLEDDDLRVHRMSIEKVSTTVQTYCKLLQRTPEEVDE